MKTLLAGLLFFIATVAVAAPVSDTYVVPVAGHVAGANGAVWLTDLAIHNVTGSAISVELAGIAAGGAVMDLAFPTVTVGAHGTAVLRDVVSSGIGALVVTGSDAFTLTARVHSAQSGADIVPASAFLDAGSSGGFLTGLVSNSGARTNIGFLAVAGASPLRIEIALLDAGGSQLGARSFDVAAGGIEHLQFSSREIAALSFDAATARVRVLEGDGVVSAYASVVDESSGDATFVPAALDDSSSMTARQRDLLRQAASEVNR